MKPNNNIHTSDMVPVNAPEPADDWHTPRPDTLPEPTAWPFVLSIGVCLLAWGVVTSWVISLIGGLIAAVAIGGWIRRMRDEQSRQEN